MPALPEVTGMTLRYFTRLSLGDFLNSPPPIFKDWALLDLDKWIVQVQVLETEQKDRKVLCFELKQQGGE